MVACYTMPYVCWILFALLEPSNVLDNTSIGIYNWGFSIMTAVFSLQGVIRIVPAIIDPLPFRKYVDNVV